MRKFLMTINLKLQTHKSMYIISWRVEKDLVAGKIRNTHEGFRSDGDYATAVDKSRHDLRK